VIGVLEYLEKLVEDKEYEKALEYAEQLLLNPENKPWDMMVIYAMLLQARFETAEFYGAQVAGQLAVKMAQDLEAWDYYGTSTLCLGTSYDRLGQKENALSAWYDYLAHVTLYRYDLKPMHHVMVLYNIGLVLAELERFEESLVTLRKAAETAMHYNNQRAAHGIRHALIDAHLKFGRVEEVPRLLAQSAHYLRHNTGVVDYMQSLLWHQVLRVRYAVETHRLKRAAKVAERGLRLAEGWPNVLYQMHLWLARIHEQSGDIRRALQEALHARTVAMSSRRFDLEFAAANYVYGLLSSHGDLAGSFVTDDSEAWVPPATS
ncbi:MAG: hypothetical protein ACOY93_16550, partial [Bacillota bacterium]